MDLSYPLGKFDWPASVAPERLRQSIFEIAAAPALFRDAVHGLNDRQLDTPYRPDGWTSRQVVHHVADSHMNSYIRLRLALTEVEPGIKPYSQPAWSALHDARTMPVEASLKILEGLHSRWEDLLHSMSSADFARAFRHPELGLVRLDTNTALYAWHGRHHAAHITGLRERMHW